MKEVLNMSLCKNCRYYRRKENDKYPKCYFKPKAPGDIPPCEEVLIHLYEDDFEEYYDEEDYDMEEISYGNL